MLEQQVSQVPPAVKPLLEYMLKKAGERLAELEAKGK